MGSLLNMTCNCRIPCSSPPDSWNGSTGQERAVGSVLTAALLWYRSWIRWILLTGANCHD